MVPGCDLGEGAQKIQWPVLRHEGGRCWSERRQAWNAGEIEMKSKRQPDG